ncbi:MAG: MauE/DoxX family redox-associated membrane protein [Syntrophobacter sp.]
MKNYRGKYLLICTRIGLGSIFIAASVLKIVHPAEFAQIIHNYQILPDSMVNLTAIILPWLEALLGVLILFGIWLPGAAVVSNLLLLAFFSALMFNLARGLNIHCGCFTTSVTGTPQTAWYIVRDSFFLLLGLGLLTQVFRKGPRSTIRI